MLPGDSDVVHVVDPPGSVPDHPCGLFVVEDRDDEPVRLQDPSPLVQVRREVADAEADVPGRVGHDAIDVTR